MKNPQLHFAVWRAQVAADDVAEISPFRAWVANGRKLPKKLAMDVDRMFCQALAGNCYRYLNLVLEEFGVEELYVRNGSGKVFKLTPTRFRCTHQRRIRDYVD